MVGFVVVGVVSVSIAVLRRLAKRLERSGR